jgi:hypothetical protein
MKLKHDDRFNLELLAEEIMRRNRRYGVVGVDGRALHNPDQFKKDRTDDLKGSTTPDSSLGIVGSIRSNTRQLLKHAMRYYGIDIRKFVYDEGWPTDGSVVYRGHKHPNPFSKGLDSKALDDKTYFTNQASYAYGVYSTNYNKYSDQIGQSGFNTFQSRLQEPNANKKFEVGFFTIATPNDPDAITWYANFGYERSLTKSIANEHLGRPVSRDKIQQLRDAECVEPASTFKKIRTYLIYDGSMISFNNLKKYVPELYDLVINSRVVGDDDLRAI